VEPAIKKLGKQGRDENSKFRVNEDDEESFADTGVVRMHASARGCPLKKRVPLNA
jgi:hypothetical protein